MQMITELEPVPHETIPGRKIQVHEFSVNNFHLHNCLTQLSRLMLGGIENQTNNMKGEVVPRDVSSLRVGWAAFKATWQFALDHNNPPSTAHEFGYKILFATKKEIQRVSNIKLKMVIQHIDHLAEIVMSADSANSSGNIGLQSERDIKSQIVICEDAFNLWLGMGSDNTDVGMAVPIFKHLGILKPDNDMDYASVSEPSADAPTHGRPDVNDSSIMGD